MNQRSRLNRAGFFISEIVMALFVLALMTSLLVTALYFQNRAARILGERREAVSRAERTLIVLQNARLDEHPGVEIRRVDQASIVEGRVWVQVVAAYPHGQVSLFGLVPEKSLPREIAP